MARQNKRLNYSTFFQSDRITLFLCWEFNIVRIYLKDEHMNREIVPAFSRKVARTNIVVDIEKWRNFAQRITKNPFVKTFLLAQDENTCAWCDRLLKESKVIHHIDYNHYCSYDVVIRISAPTANNPCKTRVVPDCESCRADNNDRFMACMAKLVLVHVSCNKKISEPK